MNRIKPENKEKLEALVQQVMEAGNAAGLAMAIVDKSGQVQYQKFWGWRDKENRLPIHADTIFGLASVSKSFTTLAIMQLAEQGILSLDDPVANYLPEFTGKNQREPVRIWHLLCHSGGYFPLRRQCVDEVAQAMGLREEQTGDFAYYAPLAAEGCRRVAQQMDDQTELQGRPGERMSYCNDGFGLLSEIIRRYGGEPSFAEYVQRHICEPLGMARSSADFVRPAQDANAAVLYSVDEDTKEPHADHDYHRDAFVLGGGGAMKSTLADMCRYVTMYLNDGLCPDGSRLCGEYWLHEMARPRQEYAPFGWYGYGMYMRYLDELTVWGHGGSLPGVSSHFCWSKEAEAGVVVLCNTTGVSVGVLADSALRMYNGREPVLPRPAYQDFPWSDSFIDQVVGRYEMAEGERFRLFRDEAGALAMEQNGERKALRTVSPALILTEGKFSDGFVQILQDSRRGVFAARCGSRIFPKVG